MKMTYSQRELKEEYMRRHAKDLETTPIYCVNGKYVMEKPQRWHEKWWPTTLAIVVIWSFIFYIGYDVGQSLKCEVE